MKDSSIGNDPENGYARTGASQTALVSAGVACGSTVIAAKDTAESPFGSTRKDDPLVESGLLGPVRLPNPARQSLGR